MDLFTSAKNCSYCGLPPRPKPGKEHIFNGFRDAKTKQLVCWSCTGDHDLNKKKSS